MNTPKWYLETAERYLTLVDQAIEMYPDKAGKTALELEPLLHVGEVFINMAKTLTFAGPYLSKQTGGQPSTSESPRSESSEPSSQQSSE